MLASQRGSIIAFSLIVLSFILTAGLAVVTVSSLEREGGLVTQKSTVAFQAADSGAERVLERIYIDNSPSTSAVAFNGAMTDTTLTQLANNLIAVAGGATCDGPTDKILATNNTTPAYSFEVAFYDGSGNLIDCTSNTWRDSVVRIKVEGFYRGTARVIEMGIKPRPLCELGETVSDANGNSYDIIPIGDQCWMGQNMRVGTRVNSSTAQTNNGTFEYYCYGDSAGNCTSSHPNEPDGGLYTWDEAMDYDTTEGSQGICPNNWHIPTEADWNTLANELDSTVPASMAVTAWNGTDIGTKLKPGGTSGFEFNLAGATGGSPFAGRDTSGYMWSSTVNNAISSRYYHVSSTENRLYVGNQPKSIAMSVRCIKD